MPAYGQPPGYPAPMYQPATARKPGGSSMMRVILLLGLMVLAIFFIVMIFKALSATDDNPGTNVPPPVATTELPPPTTESSTSPTVEPTKPTDTPGTTTPPAGTYANDDYVVPDPDLNPPGLPEPQTYGDAQQWLQNNAFYDQMIPVPVRCEIPNIDPSTASDAELETYLNDAVACLMRAWGPALEAAGYNASRPSVTVYSGEVQSACGKMPAQNALYCAADQQVYYATDLPSLFPQYMHDPLVPVAVIAHEFGHAIQAQTGMLFSEMAWQQYYTDNGDDASANDLSRRTEVQADCFAGAFFQAITKAVGVTAKDQTTLGQVFFSIGDDQLTGDPNFDGDHGQGANRRNWLKIGLKAPTAGSCNTFADSVSSDQVR